MTGKIEIVLIAIVAVILSLSLFGAYHYHNAWIDVKEEKAKLEVSYAQLEGAANLCSANTLALKKANEDKANDIQKAQAQAAKLAKNNESLAQSLLSANNNNPADSCSEAVKLYQQYKASQK